MIPQLIVVYKNEGETLAVLLERVRRENGISDDIPLTYAGRLDPMAEGLVIVLAGEECKKKDQYLGLDKTYEYEVLFGMETDTFDVLGIPHCVMPDLIRHPDLDSGSEAGMTEIKIKEILPNFLGKITQTYPPYSSKTINGIPLFQLAREGKFDETDLSHGAEAKLELPKIDIEIYSHEFLGMRTITHEELLSQVTERIKKVEGDFRQSEILSAWHSFYQLPTTNYVPTGHLPKGDKFSIASFRISCSSGTYIRRIASDMGRLLGTGAIAWKIKRVKIGDISI